MRQVRGKIRGVADMRMDKKRPRGRPMLRWRDSVTRNMKDDSELATDRSKSMTRHYPTER